VQQRRLAITMNEIRPEVLTSRGVQIAENPVLGWCLLLLLVAVVAASCGRSTTVYHGVTTSLQPESTQLQFIAPVDAHGHPLSGITISSVASGSCEPGSDVLGYVAGNIYRCDSAEGVADPCWAADYGMTPTNTVLCMRYPWTNSAFKITTSGLPPEGVSSKSSGQESLLDFQNPWGVELVTGQRCLMIQAGSTLYEGIPVHWACSNNLLLLENIDVRVPLWHVTEIKWNGQKYVYKGNVSIKRVWFPTALTRLIP
jgi:hypothetical protein